MQGIFEGLVDIRDNKLPPKPITKTFMGWLNSLKKDTINDDGSVTFNQPMTYPWPAQINIDAVAGGQLSPGNQVHKLTLDQLPPQTHESHRIFMSSADTENPYYKIWMEPNTYGTIESKPRHIRHYTSLPFEEFFGLDPRNAVETPIPPM